MEDAHGDCSRAALALGVRERGARAKTGSNQGALLDRAYAGDMLLGFREHLEVAEFLFPDIDCGVPAPL
eukprot:668449-Pyramimonas_sp.AAC.1